MVKKTFMSFCVIIFSLFASILFAATSPLPSQLIALSSLPGNKIFSRSYSPSYFWPLELQFVAQQNRAYCSIASSIMILNALGVAAPKDPIYAPFEYFTQDNFFTPDVEKILSAERVKKQGSSLEEISLALATFPVSVKKIYANEITVAEFRKLAKNIMDTRRGYIIVNFLRTEIGEEGAGHMSPLAAYDKTSDRFLMLDVARYRYPSVWVKTQDLWNAMHTMDKDSGVYRGFVVVAKR